MSEMLQGMITEEELLKLLNLKPSELSYLRNVKGLPFVKLSLRKRVFLEKDLMAWFEKHRVPSDPENVLLVSSKPSLETSGKPLDASD